jgi:hypothetical protein
MSEYDMVDRLEKQLEGSNLALAAVAEVLQKMDSRLSKADEEEFEFAQEQNDAIEKQQIIKAVAGQVYGLIKAEAKDTADWGYSEGKAKGISNDKADSEVAAPAPRATKDVQVTLEAMQKQLNLLKQGGYFGDEDAEDDEAGVDERDERDDEERKKERTGEHSMYSVENAEAGYPVIENMQKQIQDLQAQLQGSFDMQKMVQNETEGRLRKMGFREETSLQRPMQVQYGDGLGVDGTTPIQKTADSPEAMVDQMMNMSYKDLRTLQEKIQQGETDGIPQEFIQ